MYLDLSYDMHYISLKSLKLPYNVPICHFKFFFFYELPKIYGNSSYKAYADFISINCLIVETTGTQAFALINKHLPQKLFEYGYLIYISSCMCLLNKHLFMSSCTLRYLRRLFMFPLLLVFPNCILVLSSLVDCIFWGLLL
jgi:hypothetical protein